MTMTNEVTTTLGDRIQSEMQRKGLSMRALARSMETAQPTVFKWIHGQNEPSLKSLKKMADIFNVSPSWLIYGDEIDKYKIRGNESESTAAMIISEDKVSYINSASCLYHLVNNDEMIPTLDIGSTVVIDRTVTSIVQSGIYLVEVSGELILRRFRRSLDGSIRAFCDNSSKYPDVEVLESDQGLRVLGKVISKITIEKVG